MDAAEVRKETELRGYELNKTKAIDKKLQYTEREMFTAEETAGGITVQLNTGMYELLKAVVHKYYSDETNQYDYQHIPVIDHRGSLVETKYKVAKGRSKLYTLNMYHTKCALLINGRNPRHFLFTDFANMVSEIQAELTNNGTPLASVNEGLKELLIKMKCQSKPETYEGEELCVGLSDIDNEQCTEVGEDDFQADLSETQVKAPYILEIDSDGTYDVISGSGNQHEADEYIPAVNSKVTNNISNQTAIDILLNLQSELSDVKSSLSDHIKAQAQQMSQFRDDMNTSRTDILSIKALILDLHEAHDQHMSQLRDEMCSSRHNISSRTTRTEIAIDSLNENIDKAHAEEQTNSEILHRKLQSILDTLKRMSTIQITNSSTGQKEHYHKRGSGTERSYKSKENKQFEENKQKEKYVDIETNKRKRNKTLIIGDSITKGISVRGLTEDVDVITLRGARINSVLDKVRDVDMSRYHDVVIYVGGNDVSNGKRNLSLKQDLRKMTNYVRESGCRVNLCTMSPRSDADVVQFNDIVKQLSKEYDENEVNYLDIHSSFIDGNGDAIRQFYFTDGIHLNKSGSNNLVRQIHKVVPIVKQTPSYEHTCSYNIPNTNASVSHSDRDGDTFNRPYQRHYETTWTPRRPRYQHQQERRQSTNDYTDHYGNVNNINYTSFNDMTSIPNQQRQYSDMYVQQRQRRSNGCYSNQYNY